MRSCMALLLVASLLMMVAAADEELVTAGPFQVSFDMGASSPYQLEVNQSLANAGILSISIFDQQNFAYISGYTTDRQLVLSAYDLRSWLNESFNDIFVDIFEDPPESAVKYYTRDIDGQGGLLGVLDLQNARFFMAAYCKNFGDKGSVIVEMGSFYPWDRETESLLNSIVLEYSPGVSTSPFGTPIGAEEDFGTLLDRSIQDDISQYNISSKEVRGAHLLANITDSV